ncbi:uncharacterized protein PAC_05254 [Phialocephala subalpina]|uniref:Uncharacterized protein n=1 Tax=Phialocephala subalpina TaxID=576137 RepID=A0A1L7WRG6_9HELO|nr:uncharacterized protein PAC_05254 [Phialocephala subalpina]
MSSSPRVHPFNSICLGHSSENRTYPSNAKIHLDFLELNGDLYWLQPPSDDLSAHTWPRGTGVSKERLDELVAQGQRVGIEFPKAFLTLIGSTKLIERFFLGGDYFYLGPSLVKCNPEDDNNGGGYVINFLSDQQGCRYWALYLAPGGYHCVLNAPCGVHCWKCADEGPYGGPPIEYEGHPKYELYEGVPIACEKLELFLAHPSFEAWLAMLYFDAWCDMGWRAGRDLSESQREYLEHFGERK